MVDATADWSIQDIARIAGTTSRTLRHYDELGLLTPSRIAANGYRHYDRDSLVRLQRILLLRDLGLGLPAIARVLDDRRDAAPALRDHLTWLRDERDRLARQIASVEATIHAVEEGGELVAEEMFDGFDHTQYKEEVEERWGKEAYAASDRWWRGMTAEERAGWQQRQKGAKRPVKDHDGGNRKVTNTECKVAASRGYCKNCRFAANSCKNWDGWRSLVAGRQALQTSERQETMSCGASGLRLFHL